MTLFFRSKSCRFAANPHRYYDLQQHEEDYEDEESEEEEEESDGEEVKGEDQRDRELRNKNDQNQQRQEVPILGIVAAVLRKSLVTCSVERGDDEEEDEDLGMEIGCPTDVRHIAHVTFDRFNGFLGLPVEFLPEVPWRAPSASVRVFGVSPRSMQCSIDPRGNSVPTILLMMQKRLYEEGGLRAEGIFRINAENSQEECVRSHLNKGVIPRGIDVHCLAGLIKAWFRELPTGVLDSLRPEQVMHCNTVDECTELVMSLPQTEAALLDWAINLMADVVEKQHLNKMNARNIAMVFAPNMTQMTDPLTALIHAVQVMNFLKTLIEKTLHDRVESASVAMLSSSSLNLLEYNTQPPHSMITSNVHHDRSSNAVDDKHDEGSPDMTCIPEKLLIVKSLHRSISLDRYDYSSKKTSFHARKKYDDDGKLLSSVSCSSSPVMSRERLPSKQLTDG